MKLNKKVIFFLIVIFTFIGSVFAVTYQINVKETLWNTVSGNTTNRNTVKGTNGFGQAVVAQMLEVTNVSGTNASGGIRVKTTAKKINLGIVTNTKEMYIPVYPTTTSSKAIYTYNTSTNKIRVEWEDWTGNTNFNARFVAFNKE